MGNLTYQVSYFYNLRFLPPEIIPISTALSDPRWFRPGRDGEPFLDSRGVLCGINFPEFHHPRAYGCGCPCTGEKNPSECRFLKTYRQHLSGLSRETIIGKFEALGEYLKSQGLPVSGFCLMVYETPGNPCSERAPLQELWRSWGLDLPEFTPAV